MMIALCINILLVVWSVLKHICSCFCEVTTVINVEEVPTIEMCSRNNEHFLFCWLAMQMTPLPSIIFYFLVGMDDLMKLGWEYWKSIRLQLKISDHLIFTLKWLTKFFCNCSVILIRSTPLHDKNLQVDIKILIFGLYVQPNLKGGGGRAEWGYGQWIKN